MLLQDLAVDTFVSTYALSLSIDLGRSFVECGLNFFKEKRVLQKLENHECAFVLPCYNSGTMLKQTLRSLPVGYKIYCVANACSDDTEAVISSDDKATLISTPLPGKIRAVLLGALQAKKDGYTHFVLLDDDILWPKDDSGLDQELTVYDKKSSCTALPVLPDTSLSQTWIMTGQLIEYAMMIVSKRAQSLLGNVIMASGAAGIFRIDDFIDAMSEHDGEHVGDDLQTSFIFHTKGYKIDFNSSLLIKTEPPSTLSSWWRQRTKRWEPSPIFNFVWHLKIIFAWPFNGPEWWIRVIAFYRILVIKLDILRFVTLPFALIYNPLLFCGILVITYLSLVSKIVIFKRYFFAAQDVCKRHLITYPLYGALCWISRLFSIPRGLSLLIKYWVLGRRKTLLSKVT